MDTYLFALGQPFILEQQQKGFDFRMKKHYIKTISLLAGAALLLTSTGCGKKEEGSAHVVENGEIETTATEEPTPYHVDEYPGVVGEEMNAKEIHATMDHIYLSDYTFTDTIGEVGLLFCQITIQNDTDDAISVNFLSQSFTVEADGEPYAGVGVRGPRFITREFGEDAEFFNEPIAAGETRQGYVCVEAPADFQNVVLTYYPAAGLADWSEAFTFDMAREDMEPAPAPVTPFDS